MRRESLTPTCLVLVPCCQLYTLSYDNGTISACLIMSDFQTTFFLDNPAKTATIVSVPMAASCVSAVVSHASLYQNWPS